MKDYTKYYFAAIVGAEVSVLLKNKVEWGGTLIVVDDKEIFLLINDNPLALEGHWFAIKDIIPGSLHAKIKVEDMSVKQLKCLAEDEKDFFDKDEGEVQVILDMKRKMLFFENGLLALDREHTFGKYIDCTEWGWKHE